MKLAIIGGGGYIGSFLHKELSTQYDVRVFDIVPTFSHVHQVRGADIATEVLQTFDVVIYLAGLSGRASCLQVSEKEVFEENIEDLLTLGRRLLPSQRLIYASSASLLEGSHDTPAQESYPIQETLLDPYARSMHQREQHVKTLSVPTVGLRFGTVIGVSPKQRHDLVHIAMVRSAYLQNIIRVQHPRCCRAILWMQDLLQAVSALLRNPSSWTGHKVYHLASFNATIRSIAEAVSVHTNIPLELGEDGGIFGFSLDTTAFETDFAFTFHGTQERVLQELTENIGHLCMDDKEVSSQITQECRVCKGAHTHVILDMGKQPLANNYVQLPFRQDEYPLCLIRCKDCQHTQLNFTVRPEVMFRNYQYNSGTSRTLREYFATLATKILTDTQQEKGIVLELACNDGSQLDEFRKMGWETYGVDPAENLVQRGREMGHAIFSGFWGVDEFPEIPVPDVIVAQNVLAHVPDPIRFLRHCSRVMNDHTYLYIQTSQCNMYRNGEFDTIYHEHLSFFTIASMMKAAEMCGLSITEVTKQPIHGTSYLFQMRKQTVVPHHLPSVMEARQEEAEVGLYSDAFYDTYRERVMHIKQWVCSKLAEFAQQGIPWVGYGAAAKGMTLLNFFDVHGMEYIVDDATMKHHKYTPGKNIIILPPTRLQEDKRTLVVVVFAWNFMEEILQKVKSLREGTKTYILQPFPNQCVFEI